MTFDASHLSWSITRTINENISILSRLVFKDILCAVLIVTPFIYFFPYQENVTLIKEINDLRRELKIARTQVHDLETALGVMRKQQQFPEDEEIGNMDNKRKLSEENVEMEKMIDMQKTEIRKLRVQIKDMETVINSRPPSGSRLPPVAVG